MLWGLCSRWIYGSQRILGLAPPGSPKVAVILAETLYYIRNCLNVGVILADISFTFY